MKTIIKIFIHIIFPLFPATRCFGVKRALLRAGGANIGKNVRVCSSVKILGNARLTIGDNTWIGHNTLVVCSAPVVIGENVNIAPMCFIGTGTHEVMPKAESVAGPGVSLPITIGNGCWLCARSTIIAGCEIGERTVVAAGAVVIGNQPSDSLVGGVPAHVLKQY